MYHNPQILSIDKLTFQKIFEDFLKFRSESLNELYIESLNAWIEQSTHRFISNAFLPSGEQFRYLNNIGSQYYYDVLLIPDHEDITAQFFNTLNQSGVVIRCEHYAHMQYLLDVLKERISNIVRGKSVYTKWVPLFQSKTQITYRDETQYAETLVPKETKYAVHQNKSNSPVVSAVDDVSLPVEALNNLELLNHYIQSMDEETLGNQIELLNEGSRCGY